MSLADALNTDVNVLGVRLSEGVRWWWGELRAMAAPLLTPAARVGSGVTAERQADGAFLIRRQGGADVLHRSSDPPVAAALTLPREAVLFRWAPAPPSLGDGDLRRMVALDLDRLTPFQADDVYYEVARPRAAQGGAGRARIAVILRDAADRTLADAQGAGVTATALLAADREGAVLDLLPAMRRAGAIRPDRRAAYLWTLVGVLLALNVAAAVWRDVRETARLQAAVAAERPVAARIRGLRREAQDLALDLQAQAAARRDGEPLRVLDALTRAIPDGAWVQRLSLDGASVRVAGLRREGLDVAEALRRASPLVDVRNADPAATPAADAFDLVATLTRPAENPAAIPAARPVAGGSAR